MSGCHALRLVAQVVHRRAAGQRGRRRPQRVVRRRDQHLVAVVEQGLQRHRDQLGDPVAQVDVVDVEPREALDQLVAGDHRTPGGQDALRVGVALGVRQRLDHVPHDHVGRLEAERRRVADVQLEDAVPFGLQPRGVLVHRAADLVQDVLKLGRLREGTLPVVTGERAGAAGEWSHHLWCHYCPLKFAVKRQTPGQRLPGGRAPRAMPSPFTGGRRRPRRRFALPAPLSELARAWASACSAG